MFFSATRAISQGATIAKSLDACQTRNFLQLRKIVLDALLQDKRCGCFAFR
jgi:hypothetical protein